MAAAVACGHDVEIVSARTEWETHYAQPDGHLRVESSIVAVRTRASGRWEAIDTSLVPGADGFRVASAVSPMQFSDGTPGAPLARVEHDGSWLTLDSPFDLPEPVLTGPSQLTYTGVLPGVDLLVTVNADGTGFGEALRVADAKAAADPRLSALDFPVSVSSGLSVGEAEGGFEAVGRDGSVVFSSPQPLMWDSREVTPSVFASGALPAELSSAAADRLHPNLDRRARSPQGIERVEAMGVRVGDGKVRVTPSRTLLDDPDTVWPVYIDPQISTSRNEWVALRNVYSPKFNWSGDEGMGRCGTTGAPMYCPKVYTSRLAWEFGNLQGLGSLLPNQVISATFKMYGVHSYSCTASPVELWRMPDISSSTQWPGTWMVKQDTRNVSHKPACNNVAWIEFNALEGARAVAANGAGALTLGVHATNESDSTGWKRYRYDAAFSYVYDRPPNRPTNLHTTDPGSTCGGTIRGTTPTLWATLSDPDSADLLRAQATVRNKATNAVVWQSAKSGAQASGASHAIKVPAGKLASNTAYVWQMQAFDARGIGGQVASCTFTVDITPPPTPTVTPVPTGGVVYTENAWNGGREEDGQFTFGNSATDFDHYQYWFDGQTPTDTRLEDGRNFTVSFTPHQVGLHVLQVKAFDHAGNASEVREYWFMVSFPTLIGLWQLDDGAGSPSAVDTAPVPMPHPLTLSSTGLWADATIPRQQDPGAPDKALQIGGLGDEAHTVEPVMDTSLSYSVMATVRLDATGSTATAMSNDSQNASGFELGYRSGDCPSGAAGCWAFSVNTEDTATPGTVVAESDVPVVAGQWVQLTGVYADNGQGNTGDHGGGKAQVYVCVLGTDADPGLQDPVASPWATIDADFTAAARLKIGQGQAGGIAVHPWKGQIADAWAWNKEVDDAYVRMTCQNPS